MEKKIDNNTLKYIEFLCYYELKACGYKLFFNLSNSLKENKKEIENSFRNDLLRKVSWRSDSGNLNKEIKFEFLRHTNNRINKKENIYKYYLTQEFYDIKNRNEKIKTRCYLIDYNKILNRYSLKKL